MEEVLIGFLTKEEVFALMTRVAMRVGKLDTHNTDPEIALNARDEEKDLAKLYYLLKGNYQSFKWKEENAR
jgi:hypothetical protein